jgi:tetratricopeptide (TPR) repeat protein
MATRQRKYSCDAPDTKDASLRFLCDQIVAAVASYSDLAEQIENTAYTTWMQGDFEGAVNELRRITIFFERLEIKNEENTHDLADLYFLIGQLYQYAARYPESIEWFSKSIFVEDGNSLPYHAMAESYLKTGDVLHATRSFEQELTIDGGNLFTYLRLVDLYNKAGKPEVAEESLKRLLGRDPENILGLHRLIRHYEKNNPSIDIALLHKRVLGINRELNATEAVIRSCYLCREKRYADALAFIAKWEQHNHPAPLLHTAQAYIFGKLKRFGNRKKALSAFVIACHGRKEVIDVQTHEFGEVFGDAAERQLRAELEKIGVKS